MHLVGFTLEIHYDARLCERQFNKLFFTNYEFFKSTVQHFIWDQ